MSSDKSQPPVSAPGKKGMSVLSLIIWALVLVVIGVVLFVSFTETGQVMMGNVANKGLWVCLFGEGDEKAEFAAADELGKAGVRFIKEQTEGVTSIDFGDCPKPTAETVQQIAKLRRLSTANLSRTEITDDQLACLENMNHLSNLLISGATISDAGIAHLASLPALQHLEVCNTKVTDAGMSDIAKISSIAVLSLSGTGITNQGIKQISHMPNINWLIIENTKVTDEGLPYLETLPELKRLTISKNMNISDEALEKLKKTFPKLIVDVTKAEAPSDQPNAGGDEGK
jgi:hypothetical protein